jgi:hypothetical protein
MTKQQKRLIFDDDRIPLHPSKGSRNNPMRFVARKRTNSNRVIDDLPQFRNVTPKFIKEFGRFRMVTARITLMPRLPRNRDLLIGLRSRGHLESRIHGLLMARRAPREFNVPSSIFTENLTLVSSGIFRQTANHRSFDGD